MQSDATTTTTQSSPRLTLAIHQLQHGLKERVPARLDIELMTEHFDDEDDAERGDDDAEDGVVERGLLFGG